MEGLIMKKILIALASIAALSFIASCTKEEANSVEEQGKQITITASIPEEGLTKVGFESVATGMKLTWEAGDQITISDPSNSSNTQVFTLVSGEGTKSATFKGTALTPATSYKISYDAAGSYTAQTQAEDGDTGHLKFAAELAGVNTYEDFTFSQSWATAHGSGTYTSSAVLCIKAQLPETLVNDGVYKVIIKSDKDIFAGGKVIEVSIDDPTAGGSDDIFTVYASLPAGDQAVAAGTKLIVQFQGSDDPTYKFTAYRELEAMTIKAGYVNKIGIKCQNIESYANASNTNIGTAANPYLIGDQNQMAKMYEEMGSGKTVYFTVVDDIDMTGIDWIPLNYSGSYDRGIYFDGGNHTISNLTVDTDHMEGTENKTHSYPSFAGVAYGTYKNVTFDKANITAGSNNAGVFAGYVGTGTAAIYATCSGITVSNSTITAAATTTKRNTGGFAGVLNHASSTITDCHVTGTNSFSQTSTSNQCSVAGFIGNIAAAGTISGCTATANISNEGSYYTAGFIGQVGGAVAASIENCAFLGGTIEAGRVNTTNSPVGGFIARIASNAGATITNCYVDGAQITAIQSGRCGGFVGDTGDKDATHVNTFTSCYVKNSSVSAAQHAGGFGGVFYTTAKKCYVESTTITANDANNGGFVGYPQKATIEDCYVSSSVTVNGGTQNAVGGFIGIAQNGNTIKNCYEAATVTGSSASVGAFIGLLNIAQTSVEKCIAWNATLPFLGSVTDGVSTSEITNNYTGTTGTISGQATSLGWDSSVWDLTGAVPTLK